MLRARQFEASLRLMLKNFNTSLSQGLHIGGRIQGRRSFVRQAEPRHSSTPTLRQFSDANNMSDISDSDWNDVKSSLLGLINSQRSDRAIWQTAFQMSQHYLEVRSPPQHYDELVAFNAAPLPKPVYFRRYAQALL